MITKINIKNFKSLEDVTIECNNLLVLTGLNGMGKSSLIQMLLLLRQSYEKGFLTDPEGGLILNGNLVDIGTAKEALFQFAKKEEINFNIHFKIGSESIEKSWFFAYEINQSEQNNEERKYSDSDFMPYSEGIDRPKGLEKLPLFMRDNFKYLNADRWVKNEYGVSDLQVIRYRSLGKHGEYTAHYLDHYATTPINKSFLFPENDINELKIQVSAWMNEISPGTKVVTEKISGSTSVKLRYVLEAGKESTTELTPLNVGFGITYILSVLVALLSAKTGDLLIIENPEAHIHPQGQSVIASLISQVAESGVQVIIETHSDHIINGILVQSKKFEDTKEISGINKDNLNIYYFNRLIDENNAKPVEVKIVSGGRTENRVPGFFDQIGKDLRELI